MGFQSYKGLTNSLARSTTFVLVLTLVTSCVVSDEGEPPNNSENGQPSLEGSAQPTGEQRTTEDPVAESITSSTRIGPDFQVEVLSLSKQADKFIILSFSMVNLSDSENAPALTPPKDRDSASDFQSMALVDTKNQMKHLPLFYKSGECYCGDWDRISLEPGDRMTTWLAFSAPPDSVDSMTLLTSVTPPMLDIPISDVAADQPPSGDLTDTRVWDLRSLSDEVNGSKSREETPEQMAVSLSSDVLFDLNESDLTENADQILKQVSKEIEDSSATNVSVDGHTDNTGTNSVNTPLSEERAETTKNRLTELVDKPITYEVAGHGSTEPIASNETDEGRARNRRVTITFDK